MLTAADVIRILQLKPLPGEGGFYRETLKVPDPDHEGAFSNTAILFLVTPESWSGLHMLETDELFHFYMGDECRMVVCSPDGELEERRLGTDLHTGAMVQSLVPGKMWQGTRLAGDGAFGFALLGTTMTPGFRADQFTLAHERDLAHMPVGVAAKLRPFLSPGTNQVSTPLE
jgi:predicted cupin superfamily sugar epimerase